MWDCYVCSICIKHFQNEKTRSEIQSLVDKKDDAALSARMNGRLLFGTAGERSKINLLIIMSISGVRARMEAGFARLNDLTIIQVERERDINTYNQYSYQLEIQNNTKMNN